MSHDTQASRNDHSRRTRNLHLRQDELAGAANVGVCFIVELEAGKPTAQLGKALAVMKALAAS